MLHCEKILFVSEWFHANNNNKNNNNSNNNKTSFRTFERCSRSKTIQQWYQCESVHGDLRGSCFQKSIKKFRSDNIFSQSSVNFWYATTYHIFRTTRILLFVRNMKMILILANLAGLLHSILATMIIRHLNRKPPAMQTLPDNAYSLVIFSQIICFWNLIFALNLTLIPDLPHNFVAFYAGIINNNLHLNSVLDNYNIKEYRSRVLAVSYMLAQFSQPTK